MVSPEIQTDHEATQSRHGKIKSIGGETGYVGAAVLQQGNCEGNDGHIFSIQYALKCCPVEYLWQSKYYCTQHKRSNYPFSIRSNAAPEPHRSLNGLTAS